MKLTDRDVELLIKEMEKSDASGQGKVNYREFLKYSYLCLMYLNHNDLEMRLVELDVEKKGLISVGQFDEIL
jgi:Ca2+-binding EF-hand superfamily protein|tara:strand:+ start:1292 stop:1507 length:216 start_codon:yes stop_codon:yes gene_type:complete